MESLELSDELSISLDKLKVWLTNRQDPDNESDLFTILATDGLKAMSFPDLRLEKFETCHQEDIVYCLDGSPNKRKPWTQLSHLISWSSEFSSVLKENKNLIATVELIRGSHEYPISVAKFHVDEAIGVVNSAMTFDAAHYVVHPDTRAANYAVNNILIDDSAGFHEIVRQVFACLFSRCVVRLIVKSGQYLNALLATLLVDLMHQSGASKNEITCLTLDRRESIGSERFIKTLGGSKNSKLSIIAAVFKQTDTFAASQGIIESYFRERYPNLIILVEEAAYSRFIRDWQRYYSHAVHIGSRVDNRTIIVDQFNSKLSIDLEAIDIKTVHKMSGNAINVLKFRNPADLVSLLSNLRKVPYMSIWNDNLPMARDFCLKNNICNEFWINHIPKSLAERRFAQDLVQYYQDSVGNDMTYIFNSVQSQFADEIEQLRKMSAAFAKKDCRLKQMLIFKAYTYLLSKNKSFKNGSTTGEMVIRLKRFLRANSNIISVLESGDSRLDVYYKPTGLAIMFVREESSVKSRPILVEFIFKNLIVGNAVLLVCPNNTLGVKFSLEYDHVIPFKMVHENMPDISRLSLDSTLDSQEDGPALKRQCPKNSYAVEILPDMSSEICEALTFALGCRHKSIWYSNSDQSNYWSNE